VVYFLGGVCGCGGFVGGCMSADLHNARVLAWHRAKLVQSIDAVKEYQDSMMFHAHGLMAEKSRT